MDFWSTNSGICLCSLFEGSPLREFTGKPRGNPPAFCLNGQARNLQCEGNRVPSSFCEISCAGQRERLSIRTNFTACNFRSPIGCWTIAIASRERHAHLFRAISSSGTAVIPQTSSPNWSDMLPLDISPSPASVIVCSITRVRRVKQKLSTDQSRINLRAI